MYEEIYLSPPFLLSSPSIYPRELHTLKNFNLPLVRETIKGTNIMGKIKNGI